MSLFKKKISFSWGDLFPSIKKKAKIKRIQKRALERFRDCTFEEDVVMEDQKDIIKKSDINTDEATKTFFIDPRMRG